MVIWKAFKRQHDLQNEVCKFDVRVGTELQECPNAEAKYQRLWASLSAKRIDVLIEGEDEDWIVEIKPRAGMVALGQLLTYRYLFTLEAKAGRRVLATCLCAEVDPDVLPIFRQRGIALWKVELTPDERVGLGIETSPR